jgi:hypothetical protein
MSARQVSVAAGSELFGLEEWVVGLLGKSVNKAVA